jgi:predicted nucleic acid-binding protein
VGVSRIFWDTNLFIYLLEDYADLSERVVALRTRMLARGDDLITSSLTLGEILVKPLETGDATLARQYEQAIASGATIVAFDQNAARHYAAIRQDRSIRPPDAIQLACAARANTDLFVTNDARLTSKNIHGVQFIVTLEHAFV